MQCSLHTIDNVFATVTTRVTTIMRRRRRQIIARLFSPFSLYRSAYIILSISSFFFFHFILYFFFLLDPSIVNRSLITIKTPWLSMMMMMMMMEKEKKLNMEDKNE